MYQKLSRDRLNFTLKNTSCTALQMVSREKKQALLNVDTEQSCKKWSCKPPQHPKPSP